MITIPNLTTTQSGLCDIMWNCKSDADLNKFINTLPNKLQYEAKALKQLIIVTMIDQIVNTEDDCADAIAIINQVKNT